MLKDRYGLENYAKCTQKLYYIILPLLVNMFKRLACKTVMRKVTHLTDNSSKSNTSILILIWPPVLEELGNNTDSISQLQGWQNSTILL